MIRVSPSANFAVSAAPNPSFAFAPHRTWPELVWHVLAHVHGTAALPASVFDPVYVQFVEHHAGPAHARPLGEDAAVLAALLADHEALARAQLTALLFESVEEAARAATTDLADLEASPGLVAALSPVTQAAELLRCAAWLEQPVLTLLPPVPVPDATLVRALTDVLPACPRLARYPLVPVRSLRLRGRLMADAIWVGTPCRALALEPDHVAWQAAHEATVGEVAERARSHRGVTERDVEHVAVVLLAERARESGLDRAHARWLAHFAAIPTPRASALAPRLLALFRALTTSDGGA